MDIQVRLPEPPSANRWWRMGQSGKGRGHHMHLSADAQAYKNAVQMLMGGALRPIAGDRVWPVFPAGTEVALSLHWYRCYKQGDLDKRVGVLLDALQGTVYAKDAQVVELHAYRLDSDGLEGWVDVRAWTAKSPVVAGAPP